MATLTDTFTTPNGGTITGEILLIPPTWRDNGTGGTLTRIPARIPITTNTFTQPDLPPGPYIVRWKLHNTTGRPLEDTSTTYGQGTGTQLIYLEDTPTPQRLRTLLAMDVVTESPTEVLQGLVDDWLTETGADFVSQSAGLDADLSANGQRITDLSAPSSTGDAVTKGYADANYAPKPGGTPTGVKFLGDDNTWKVPPSGGTTKADLVSGKVPTAQLGSGTANTTTYLRGDQTWQPITAGEADTAGSEIDYAESAITETLGTSAADIPGLALTFATGDNPAMVEFYPAGFFGNNTGTITYQIIRTSDSAVLAIGVANVTTTAGFDFPAAISKRVPAGTESDTYKAQAWRSAGSATCTINPGAKTMYLQAKAL